MSLICCKLISNPVLSGSVVTKTSTIGLSQWMKEYVKPVHEISKLDRIEDNEELKELAFRPIRARLVGHPVSVFYNDLWNRFIGLAHRKGHKALFRELMRQTFANIKRIQIEKYNKAPEETRDQIECNPLVIFETAIQNCRPLIITRPIKRGGATYQVPYPLKVKDSEDIAMRWLMTTVKERPKPRNIFFPEAMANELIEAFYNEGKVVKKKQDIHRVCEANRAYAHYRWG